MTACYRNSDDRMHRIKIGSGILDIINVIKDNKDLIKDVGSSAINTGIAIKDIVGAAKGAPEPTVKSDKDIIEEMKTESVYKDLVDLENLYKLKTGSGFKII